MSSRFRLQISDRARALADALSPRQLLLQVCVPALVHLDPEKLDGYGGIFLHGTTQAERDTVLARLRPLCPVPPFVVADIESGPGDLPPELGLDFGTLMSHGVANDPALTATLGGITGRLSRARGFNWSLAPCVDLAADPDSPMVGTRSAGRDPERVARIAWAFASGLQKHGVLATAKHFPGDGFGTLDQHLTTVVNPLPLDAWRAGPGLAFQRMIDAGIRAVMPGHISLPAYDEPDPVLGLHPPATLSRRLMTDLLKGEMGFEGLIVSDAVNMTGFCGFMNYYDACARFLECGGDVLLFAKIDERFHAEMQRCLAEGKLTEATLRDRAARIIAMKETACLLDPPAAAPEPVDLDSLNLPGLADELAAKSVGILRDRAGLLPVRITRDTRVLHLVAYNGYERHKPLLDQFTALLRERSDHVAEWIDPGCDRLFHAARDREFDLIVCSIGGAVEYGANVLRLHGPVARNLMYGWMRLGVPTVFVAHHHPYCCYEYDAAIDCALATFGGGRPALRRLVAGLFGEAVLPRFAPGPENTPSSP
jgi:beta-N-acetylhexosaminidase